MYEIIDKQDWHNCDRLELALQQFVLSSFSELDAMWVKDWKQGEHASHQPSGVAISVHMRIS